MKVLKDKERKLRKYIQDHEKNICKCDEATDNMCWGILYLGGSQSKEDIFESWD